MKMRKRRIKRGLILGRGKGSQTPDRFCCYGGRITTVKPEKPPRYDGH
ncbi:hypothetical protein [Burkholderia contaminans]|nr:hypothetical protein [Burkholderia contaminans]